MVKLRHLLAICLLLLASHQARASFTIQDIRVEGLQRISAGTVFNYIPVRIGSSITEANYPTIIRSLFRTGFFTDIRLERDDEVLTIIVVERPAIAEIEITGNRDINTEELLKALEEVGLAEGRVFDRFILDKIRQELLRQYFSRAKYAVKIDTQVQPLERNRVAIKLTISEGVAARIRQINIIGNNGFSDEKLRKQLQLSKSDWLSFWTRNDQYSRQALAADIETLRSFYLDRGYLKFAIDSTQVSITPDKKDIYITINITEGEPYTVQNIDLAGELIVPEQQLQEIITIKSGDVFSRSEVTKIERQINDRLGDDGYAFANINTIPTLDETNKQVNLTFFIDPGRRAYVRRINFEGNLKTHDEVLRREMRQKEGAWFVTRDIERSKTRLERLSYIESVDVNTPPVPGTIDQVDVDYTVTERPSGNFIFGAGFGQESGLLLNASLNQENFLGTGKQVRLTFNNSRTNTNYSFSYNNPYHTINGVSRGFRLYFRERDAQEANLADYVIDEYGADINYGIPINEFDTIRAGLGFENLQIETTDETPDEILTFLDENGDEFLNFRLQSSWSRDRRNRTIFADQGSLNRLGLEITLPGSDAEFYKLGYRHISYYPLTGSLTLSLGGELGYGNGYGSIDELPFFENYFAGGLRSVRGFKTNTLGPRFSNGEPSGGSVKVVGNAQVIFPVPFIEATNFRLAAFIDGGNVFSSAGDFEVSELRYSTGLSALWLSPFGPLALSLATPLNQEDEDETEFLQFSFGVPF